MRVLVAIKRVADYSAQKIKIKGNAVDLTNTRMYINPFCEIAMQEAANLKAKGFIKEIIVLSIGPKGEKKILWTPLALGADRAIYVNTNLKCDSELQPLLVAQALKHFVTREKVDVVMLGKQSVDDDSNQTGQLLAGVLNWPQATNAFRISVCSGEIEVIREVESGLETLLVQPPAVITCDLRLTVPKIASLMAMINAKKAVIQQFEWSSLNIAPNEVSVVDTFEPPQKKKGSLVKDVDQLISRLQNEAKVI